MGRQHCSVIVAACLLSVFALCVGQAPIAFENVCEEEGFSDNLSCEREDGVRHCFSRDELCNNKTLCADESDEGVTTGTGLDCDGSLTGRKATDDGKVEPGFLCSSGTILDLVQLCDGTADCEGGDDETHPLCANKCLFPYYGGCFYTRECQSMAREATCGLCRPGFARDPRNYETGECVEARFRFQSSAYTMCENQERTVFVTLDTTGVLDRRVLVDVRVIGGTATVGNDFTLSTSQLVFEQFSGGELNRGVTIRAVLDSVSEDSETILLEASAGDWPFTIGENSTTVTIDECSAENLFLLPYRSVSEGSGSITTYVQLASGVDTLTEDLIVNISTSSNSAIGNVDYLETQLTLTFPNGSIGGVRIPFSVPLIDDNIAEYRENFRITASTSGNGIGVYSRTTRTRFVYINDDDPFIVEFEYPSYTVREGESVEVCLVNTTSPERIHSFTVQFYTSYDCDTSSTITVIDDATADLDYEAVYRESDVIFPPDTNRACTIINTYHDNLEEGVEKFIVRSVHSGGVGQTSHSTDILIVNVNVDPVTVSIEKSFYSITQPEDSVEICINATKISLDEPIPINLQTQYETVELTLFAAVTRTCSIVTFSSNLFSRNGRIETIQAVIVPDNRRVTLDRFQAEIALFDGNVKDDCPVLPKPANGQVEQLPTDRQILPGSIAIYSCDVGLVPDRTRFRECTADLTWSGIPPACIQGVRGIVESFSNEFIVGFATSNPGSQALVVTTNGQTVPFLVLGNRFDGVSNVQNSNYFWNGIPNTYTGKGIHIKAKTGGKVAVHGLRSIGRPSYYPSYSLIDLYLAINIRHTDDVKEYEYYSIPYNYPSSLHLIATEDNTIVNISRNATLILDRLQTHQIDEIESLKSVRVTSNKPLSIISAKKCFGTCDYLAEQLLPTHLWGKRFLVASFLGLKNRESLRILASKLKSKVTIKCAHTSITRTENIVSGLGQRQWSDVKLDEQGNRDRFCVLEASDPVQVIQFAQVSDDNSYMMTIPAIEQYGEFFTGFHTSNRSPFNFVNLYVTPEHFVPGGILVDEDAVLDWTTVRCASGEICGYISRPVLLRRPYHTVRHQDPRGRIGISAYGFDIRLNISYGYPASMYIPSPQSVDECVPNLNICDPNAQCISVNGRYECVCNDGYEKRRDETCTDIDECAVIGTSVCDVNAYCTNTIGGNNCTCNTGFIGTGKTCTPESNLTEFEDYLPFIKDKEEAIKLSDDSCEEIKVLAIPIGPDKVTQIWICENGVISIGERPFKLWRPQHFPSDNPLIQQANILAPFWNDHEPNPGLGAVKYQIFEKGPDQSNQGINRFVAYQQSLDEFKGEWMIVVSWENVSPYTRCSDVQVQQNSYQAIIISDFTTTYAVFTYNAEALKWSSICNDVYSVIGYNFDQRKTESLNIPSFQNHRFSGSSNIKQIPLKFQTQGVQWANLIYLIGKDESPIQRSAAECVVMGNRDESQFMERGVRVEQGLSCPCSVEQAFRDRRYIHAAAYLAEITGDDRFLSRNCFVQVFRPLRANRGVHMCCYSTSEESLGALLGSPFQSEASSPLRFHPYTERDDFMEYDYHFQRSCCFSESDNMCPTYTNQRRADECLSYTPSEFAWFWGDPHFTTLDGAGYTFNGWGEYSLLEINTSDVQFLLQGRTNPVNNSKATQLVAFAMEASPNSPVEIRLDTATDKFVVLFNGSDITDNVSTIREPYFSPNSDVFITRDSQNVIVCGFPIGISVTVTASSGMLSFVLGIPDDFRNITRGLMGNYNGIEMDDLAYRNGTMLAQNSSDRLIHGMGQSWQIRPDDSVFTYPEGNTALDFAFPDHIPQFLDEVVATASVNVLTACGDSVQCIFDASQTGDISIGLETMIINVANVDYRQEAINTPPLIAGPSVLVITLGQEAELVFSVTDDNNNLSVSLIGGLPINSTLTVSPMNGFSEVTFRWTITEIVDVSLLFEARDERNAVSVLSVQVQICACDNGGDCTVDGLRSTVGSTLVLNCDCPEAYDGRFCADDSDGCTGVICFEEVTCVDVPAPGVGAMCGPCPVGYFGDGQKCDDINECEEDAHNCTDVCVNVQGGFECACNQGYTLADTTSCTDVDECSVLNGGCHQVCNNFEGGFECDCSDGFGLTNDNTTCQVLPESSCSNDAICSQNCVRLFGVEVCSCNLGYTLDRDNVTCSDIDECAESPCDQECSNSDGGFQCVCEEGYVLDTDERSCLDIDECSVAAENDTDLCTSPMFCSNTLGGFECLCPGGTEQAGGTCVSIGTNVRRVNDSVIGDPLMTVPLYLTNTSALQSNINLEENEVINLCFEIHGRSDEYFNLVSDSCISVNAHYQRADPQLPANIIDEITVRAAGLDGICRNIAVSVENCQATIDGSVLDETYTSAGISVRLYRNRVRISAPNCQDLDLVMWVFCEQSELRGYPELGEPDIVVNVSMIHFVIARGLNIRESAHGLLGQFWNVPITIERYLGSLSDGSTRDDTYILTVNYPNTFPRRFVTFLHSPTWDRRGKEYCLYGGNRQGGGILEIESPNDPIIQGRYRDYIVGEQFGVDFVYSHFESSECSL
ncbi:uncharacterized protein LOC135334236 isoform X4 [Halichondria panicea]|uniref:uncharacterized protein LOC135334236 isoform X4 n=1 Tax=Halichondria panicea TaxID=6063 RepID=UPI00312B44D1